MVLSRLRLLGFLCGIACAGGAVAQTAPPKRVVSINLCTDQLAMLLAAPGQLISVSYLAEDPLSSSMVAQAQAYRINHGGAEEIYLLHPDLVLAGSYTDPVLVELLRSLGVAVLQVPPVNALDEVVGQIHTLATALGREAAGAALSAEFEAGLAQYATTLPAVTAALYYPNGYTTGAGTLANDVLARSGFRNIGSDLGLSGGGILPLEQLVLAEPQMIVTSTPYPGASRAEDILVHPALRALRAEAGMVATTSADWVCGTPHILRALAEMAAARQALGGKQ